MADQEPQPPRKTVFPMAAGAILLLLGAAALAFGAIVDQASLASLLFGKRLALHPGQLDQVAHAKRQVLLLGGACVLLGIALLAVGRRVASWFREGLASIASPPCGYAWLFTVSFLSLFFEVVFIRWISTEVRVLAFFKNVPLIAAYLGLGIGCLLAPVRRRLEVLFLPGLAVVVLFVGFGSDTYLRVLSFAGATVGQSELLIWGHRFSDAWRPLAAAVFYGGLALLFAVQVLLFVPLGHMVGRGFEGMPRIAAYSVNITGALAGIAAYNVLTQLRTGPAVWFVLGGLPVLWMIRDRWREAAVSAALLAAAIAVQDQTLLPRTWSTYNRLSLADSYLWASPDGLGRISPETTDQVEDASGRKGQWVLVGKRLDVGDLFYMDINDLSDKFLSRHPGLYGDPRLYSYNLPYTLYHPRSVCIVGSGGGNDVAAALRAGVEEVVAVEIDPVIAETGRDWHPEQPYQDKRVTLVVDDARHFFNETQKRFDLVVFGLLDSHSLFSTFSSVRLDNYVYTLEAFERVRDVLTPEGCVACCFAVPTPWIQERFEKIFTRVFRHPPLLVDSGRGITMFSRPRKEDVAFLKAAGAKVLPPSPQSDLPLSTDDWPFLYQKDRRLPAPFVWGLVLMAGMGLLGVWRLLPAGERSGRGAGQFFWLGVSFLLVEVKGISQLALVWGSTWKVTAIVIAVILVLILLANLLVSLFRIERTGLAFAALLASVLGSSFFSLATFLGKGFLAGQLLPTLVLLLPHFFAGIVFAVVFRRAPRPEVALGWNLMGGVLGGFLEYASVATGFGALALLATATYALAWITWRGAREGAVEPGSATPP